jgi:predicted membrane protein
MRRSPENEKKGRLVAGIFILGFGIILLAKKIGVELPWWLFSWQMFLIALGTYTGFKHNFKNPSWFILIAIGSIFLWDEMTIGTNLKAFVWPVVFIGTGIYLILKPKRHNLDRKWADIGSNSSFTIEDGVESINIFSGSKKTVISKNFKGGEIINIMGGTELNLMQADIQEKVKLESINIFGSTKIIMPANWALYSEVVSVFGGVDDKRPLASNIETAEKIIVLQGVNVFGGIEIKSY